MNSAGTTPLAGGVRNRNFHFRSRNSVRKKIVVTCRKIGIGISDFGIPVYYVRRTWYIDVKKPLATRARLLIQDTLFYSPPPSTHLQLFGGKISITEQKILRASPLNSLFQLHHNRAPGDDITPIAGQICAPLLTKNRWSLITP